MKRQHQSVWPDNYQRSLEEARVNHLPLLRFSQLRETSFLRASKAPSATAPVGICRSQRDSQSTGGKSQILEPVLQTLRFFFYTLSINVFFKKKQPDAQFHAHGSVHPAAAYPPTGNNRPLFGRRQRWSAGSAARDPTATARLTAAAPRTDSSAGKWMVRRAGSSPRAASPGQFLTGTNTSPRPRHAATCAQAAKRSVRRCSVTSTRRQRCSPGRADGSPALGLLPALLRVTPRAPGSRRAAGKVPHVYGGRRSPGSRARRAHAPATGSSLS